MIEELIRSPIFLMIFGFENSFLKKKSYWGLSEIH